MTSSRSRTLAAAAVLVLVTAACGGGSSSDGDGLEITGTVTASGPPGSQTARIDMTDDLTFRPNSVEAVVGTLVLTVSNAGQVPHDLTFDEASLGKTKTVKGKGNATLTVPLEKAGTYRFTCTLHRGMDGQVVVKG